MHGARLTGDTDTVDVRSFARPTLAGGTFEQREDGRCSFGANDALAIAATGNECRRVIDTAVCGET